MKRILAFLFVIPVVIFGEFFMFNDGMVYSTSVWDGWEIPEGVSVIYVDSDSWSVEKRAQNWWEILQKAKLDYVGNLPRGEYTLLSRNPAIFKSGPSCFAQLENEWFEFECSIPSKDLLRVSGKAEAFLHAEGGWEPFYILQDDDLTFFAKIISSVPISGGLFLISGDYSKRKNVVALVRAAKMSEESGMETRKVQERRIFEVGEVNIPSGETTLKVFEGRVFNKKPVYFLSFYGGSSSDWMKPFYTVEIENTRSNGLGYPMPDGKVSAFEKGIPIGLFDLLGAPVGGKIRILESEVEDLRLRLVILSSMKRGEVVLKKARIDFENYGGDREVKVKITGKKMKFVGGDITPVEETDDYLVFTFSASGKGNVNINFENAW
jgi:hypothetical protein